MKTPEEIQAWLKECMEEKDGLIFTLRKLNDEGAVIKELRIYYDGHTEGDFGSFHISNDIREKLQKFIHGIYTNLET